MQKSDSLEWYMSTMSMSLLRNKTKSLCECVEPPLQSGSIR